MAYDPTPLPDADTLTVQVEGARGKPDQHSLLSHHTRSHSVASAPSAIGSA